MIRSSEADGAGPWASSSRHTAYPRAAPTTTALPRPGRARPPSTTPSSCRPRSARPGRRTIPPGRSGPPRRPRNCRRSLGQTGHSQRRRLIVLHRPARAGGLTEQFRHRFPRLTRGSVGLYRAASRGRSGQMTMVLIVPSPQTVVSTRTRPSLESIVNSGTNRSVNRPAK
jgi:hypothetical protein